MTLQDRRTLHAVQLPDGTYVVRTGCCWPNGCIPSRGLRCCQSTKCDCPWPARRGLDPDVVGRSNRAGLAIAGLAIAILAGGTVAAVSWVANHLHLVVGSALVGICGYLALRRIR